MNNHVGGMTFGPLFWTWLHLVDLWYKKF